MEVAKIERGNLLSLLVSLVLFLFMSAPLVAQTIQPPYNTVYTYTDLGTVPGVPTRYGGLNFLSGNSNVLIIGGNANSSTGSLYSISVVRGSGNHITGFSGTAAFFADAAWNDGGVEYGPGGVLFLTRYPDNKLGETKPGSTATDKIVDFVPLGVASSPGALNFVPGGFPGVGEMKLVSWSGGQWYNVVLAADGTGTYNVTSATQVETLPGGPEGFIYVPPGSPLFASNNSMLVSEYSSNQITTYTLDTDGNPALSSRTVFMDGLAGAEGAAIDPVTGDFLFSTYGGANHVVVVQGFAAPPPPCSTIVTTTADSGAGSLRAAINCSNTTPGTDTISFNIPSSDPNCNATTLVCTISPTSDLPKITDPVIIDGYTQPGSSPNTQVNSDNAVLKIQLDGSNVTTGANGYGLDIAAGGSTVRGLIINHYVYYLAIGIALETKGGNKIAGNFIGTDPTGKVAASNPRGGLFINGTPNNIIGGTTPADRNIVSGNTQEGVVIQGLGATGNVVEGNFLGPDATGAAALGNLLNGVSIGFGAHGNTVGGTTAGARNVASGNGTNGVLIFGAGTPGTTANVVEGNYIGTNAAGTAALGNTDAGVAVSGAATGNMVGGTAAGAGNVITGNGTAGVYILDTGTSQNLVQGNFLGTDATGAVGIGNGTYGADLKSPNNTIGGTATGAGNVISGNHGGILLEVGGDNTLVQGNFIGTNPAGTAIVPAPGQTDQSNTGEGIEVYSANNTIGGTVAGAPNIIGGSSGDGIRVTSTAGNLIQGNFIGTDATATLNFKNFGTGVRLDNSSHNSIGGAATGAGNTIAFNYDGVEINDFSGQATNDAIFSNSISSNTPGLGICLSTLTQHCPTPNHSPPATSGPNNYENYPVLTSVVSQGGSTTIQGTLNSTASTNGFRIEFFDNAAADPSGYGQGKTYLGSTNVSTDASGNATINVTLPVTVANGHFVTSTATDPNNNTSEFSRALSLNPPAPTLTISIGPNSPGPTVTYTKGSTLRPMLQFRATAGSSEAVKMTAITLQASGTGNDATGVTAVRVYVDANGNGQFDAGEPLVGSGTYNADNGTLTITFTTPQVVPAGGTVTYIVTYDFTP